MRATVLNAPGEIAVTDVPDAARREPTDAVVRITHACVCGSDLWPYRGIQRYPSGARMGHEWMGIVDEVGPEVRTVRPGDRVVAPFAFSDGTCELCEEGVFTSCLHGGYWGVRNDGGQAEAVRAPLADGTLVAVPREVADDEAVLKRILPLTDVMGTGHHAAVLAGVRAGARAAVVGDGAVGLCAVLAARRLGAERIAVLGHHPQRLEIARAFGATDVVTARGEEAVAAVRELEPLGVEAVLECVGTQGSLETAIGIARPGGTIGSVGVPAGVERVDLPRLFGQNIGLRAGVAPVRAYLPELLADVVAGRLDPAPVLDLELGLEQVADGYRAMDAREAIKVMLRP